MWQPSSEPPDIDERKEKPSVARQYISMHTVVERHGAESTQSQKSQSSLTIL